jgi:hypothetical protein
MGPGADDERTAQTPVVLQRPGQEQVEPARHVHHGHLDAIVPQRLGALLPVAVAVRMPGPVLPPGDAGNVGYRQGARGLGLVGQHGQQRAEPRARVLARLHGVHEPEHQTRREQEWFSALSAGEREHLTGLVTRILRERPADAP